MSLAERYREAAAEPADRRGVTISIDHVGKSFDQTSVLNDITLSIPAGQFIAIVGRSGSGKSTLLRLICDLDQPSSGRILFDGAPPVAGVARMMFQEPRLLPWVRVQGNVEVGLRADLPKAEGRARAAEALRAVGLEARAKNWPTVLSGGQKQRVALARALVSRPRLLLLDEPLGALDALTRLEMQMLIAKAWQEQGFTAVLVTHDVAEAVKLADRIIVLQDGAVTLDIANPAPHPRVKRSPELDTLEEQLLQRLMGPT